MLLAGTADGVYRISSTNAAESLDFEQALETDRCMRVRTFDPVAGAFAATQSGLYHSLDGAEWVDLGVPRDEVYSVAVSPSGDRLYAGTHPAHVYASTSFAPESGDRECEWEELTGFQELPSRSEWHTPRHRNEAHVRSLGTHPDEPERLIAGVEVGGVHVSEDRGETWTERRIEFDARHSNDVHHVLLQGSDRYVASTGSGLYRTTDAGRSWTRIDENVDHSYFREAFGADGRLYAAAARDPPGTWGGELGPDAALFESTDGGDTFETVSYPGEPNEFVLAWTAGDATVVAGTDGGYVLRRTDGEWTEVGQLPSSIRSLTGV